MSSRKICITAADGQTGRLTAELLLSDASFSKKFKSLSLLAMDAKKCEELKQLGGDKVNVIEYTSDTKEMLKLFKAEDCDTIFLIPPAHKDKFAILKALIEIAGELKSVQNVILLSSAGCDVAERDKQPSIRQFIDMESLVMSAKGDTSMGSTGHSPCVIRYHFFSLRLIVAPAFTRRISSRTNLKRNRERSLFLLAKVVNSLQWRSVMLRNSRQLF